MKPLIDPVVITNDNFVPDYHAIYVVQINNGYLCGFHNGNVVQCIGLSGARKWDSLKHGPCARVDAIAAAHHASAQAKVLCYRRCAFYPEQYFNTEQQKKEWVDMIKKGEVNHERQRLLH